MRNRCFDALHGQLSAVHDNDNDHSSSQLCTQRSDLPRGPQCKGLDPFAVWRIARIMQKNFPGVCAGSCHLEEVGPLLMKESWYRTLLTKELLERFAGFVCLFFVVFLLVVAMVRLVLSWRS